MIPIIRWVDDSQVMVRVNKIGERDKIVVTLTEFSPHGKEIAREKLNKVATNFAIRYGALNTDFCVIRDYLTDRKATYSDGSVSVIHIRQKAYVFQGVGWK